MLLLLLQVSVAGPTTPAFAWDAMADAYLAVGSFRNPPTGRAWLTQPREDGHPDLNLAVVGGTWTAAHLRARLAVQAGRSVVANYAGEPHPTPIRHVEEGYVGIRAGPGVWLDAGIFASAIGQEGWRSTEDPTYTRSLTAEYTPYYAAGLRVLWQATPALALRLDLLNGWQRIQENNDAKAVAGRADWTPRATLLLGGSVFVGNERPAGTPGEIRRFGQLYGRLGGSDRTALWVTIDGGEEGGGRWGSATVISRLPLTPRLVVAGRGEYFTDPDQVVFSTGGPEGFSGGAGSVGIDLLVRPGVVWRTEARWLSATRAVFAGADGRSRSGAGFLVTSVAFRRAAAR